MTTPAVFMAQVPARQPGWISLHVFIHDFARLSHFVRECLGGLELPMRSGCFFIRYWVGGPHVRLRFQVPEWRERIEERIRLYLRRHPVEGTLDPTRFYAVYHSYREAEPDWYWCESGSMHYIDYQPEPERYGGPVGLPLCEDYFAWDSNMVIRILHEQPDSACQSIMLGYCLVHLTVLRQLGLRSSYLRAVHGVASDGEIAAYAERFLQYDPQALPAGLLSARQQFRDRSYFQDYLPSLQARLHLLAHDLSVRHVEDIPRIFDALLHMSFNRIGIGPRRERTVRLTALYLEIQ